MSGESALKSSLSNNNFGSTSSSAGAGGSQLEGTATISMSESVDSLESIKSNDDEVVDHSKNGGQQRNQYQQQQQQQQTPSPNNKGTTNNSNNSATGRKVFVLSGRRRKKSKTYVIGNNAFDISRDRCLAKLKSNVLGTQFTAIR